MGLAQCLQGYLEPLVMFAGADLLLGPPCGTPCAFLRLQHTQAALKSTTLPWSLRQSHLHTSTWTCQAGSAFGHVLWHDRKLTESMTESCFGMTESMTESFQDMAVALRFLVLRRNLNMPGLSNESPNFEWNTSFPELGLALVNRRLGSSLSE